MLESYDSRSLNKTKFFDFSCFHFCVEKRACFTSWNLFSSGLCEAGKTPIFSQLIYKKAIESFTSMKENVGVLDIENKVD